MGTSNYITLKERMPSHPNKTDYGLIEGRIKPSSFTAKRETMEQKGGDALSNQERLMYTWVKWYAVV